ncbi:unnamed protein product [marine sediment metagenome]|uniref:Uncharacterized protein n=1 Tax=marine sediment metagenome TaxID=412755 RepID=X0TDB2_9ZZZZ
MIFHLYNKNKNGGNGAHGRNKIDNLKDDMITLKPERIEST